MVAEMIKAITDAFTALFTQLASGIVDGFETLVMTSDGKLSAFATWGLAFIGIGLVFTVIRVILRKIGR